MPEDQAARGWEPPDLTFPRTGRLAFLKRCKGDLHEKLPVRADTGRASALGAAGRGCRLGQDRPHYCQATDLPVEGAQVLVAGVWRGGEDSRLARSGW